MLKYKHHFYGTDIEIEFVLQGFVYIKNCFVLKINKVPSIRNRIYITLKKKKIAMFIKL